MCTLCIAIECMKIVFIFFPCCCFVYIINNKVQQNSFKKVNKWKENTRNMIDDRKYVLNLWIFIMLLCLEINKMCIFMLIHLISYLKKKIFPFHFVFFKLKCRYTMCKYIIPFPVYLCSLFVKVHCVL